jgi:SAM-dependent methyltransferase
MKVLEVGVGNGSCASLLTKHAGSFSGIDITEYAVKSTSERMRCLGLKGEILQMDAERMKFSDNTFDFVWSWGVIHHTSDTRKALGEISRILKPGGKAITMVYYRNFWNYYILGGLIRGILLGELFRRKSLHAITQQSTDGAIARYYSIPEWRVLVSEFFYVERAFVCGNKLEIIPLPSGKIKNFISILIPDGISRFLTNRCKMGTFLVTTLIKRENTK